MIWDSWAYKVESADYIEFSMKQPAIATSEENIAVTAAMKQKWDGPKVVGSKRDIHLNRVLSK